MQRAQGARFSWSATLFIESMDLWIASTHWCNNQHIVCFQLGLQSSTDACNVLRVVSIVGMQHCSFRAGMNELQKLIGSQHVQ